MDKLSKTALKAAATTVVTLFLIELSLPLLGPLWHLTHRKPLLVAGIAFEIPSSYFMYRKGEYHYLRQLSPVVPFLHRTSDVTGALASENLIDFHVMHSEKFHGDRDFGRLKDFLTQFERTNGMQLDATRVLNTNAGTVYCYEFKGDREASVRCIFDGSTLTLYFTGESNHAQDVYSVLQSARFVKAQAVN